MKKNCVFCNKEFYKEDTCSMKRWNTQRKYCSWECLHLSNKGRIVSSITRSKLSLANKGKTPKNFEDMQKKGWEAVTGKPSWNKGLKGYNAGEKSHFWRGGVTPINHALRESLEYEEWRKKVFERDNYTCVKCGEIGGRLEADHIKLFSRFPELRFEISNGQTLCKACHKDKTISDLKGNWKNQFGQALN